MGGGTALPAPPNDWDIAVLSTPPARLCCTMTDKVVDPLSYATDADQSILEEIARLDGLRVSSQEQRVPRITERPLGCPEHTASDPCSLLPLPAAVLC